VNFPTLVQVHVSVSVTEVLSIGERNALVVIDMSLRLVNCRFIIIIIIIIIIILLLSVYVSENEVTRSG